MLTKIIQEEGSLPFTVSIQIDKETIMIKTEKMCRTYLWCVFDKIVNNNNNIYLYHKENHRVNIIPSSSFKQDSDAVTFYQMINEYQQNACPKLPRP